jgi:23S rRNA (uracil1939-C5)-methyltransferase
LSIDESRQQQIRRHRLQIQCAAHGIDIGAAAPITVIPSPTVTAYRHRARLQIDGTVQPAAVGFHGDRNWTIVDAAVCAMFAPPLAQAYKTLRNLILGAAPSDVADLTGAEIVALEGATGALVYLNPRDRAPAAWPRLGEEWLSRRSDLVAGVAVRLPRGDPRPEILGAPAIWGQAPLGMPVAAAARGFIQANLGCAERLALTLAKRVLAVCARPRVLELYAGSGLFGWAMADEGADVRSVEWDAAAVAAAQRLPAPRRGSFRCEVGDSRTASLSGCDVLLTDAPRAGLGALAHTIVEYGPPCVVLISCFVEPLARDLAVLVRAGYGVSEWLLADFFPQTQHTETAVILHRPG